MTSMVGGGITFPRRLSTVGDRGSRVPRVIISLFTKKGFVDHTPYETVSILKFIETRSDLPPLDARDRQAADLTLAFEF
jgi:Phosphoesterase family